MITSFLRAVAFAVSCSLTMQLHAQTAAPKSTDPIHLESVTISERGTELLVRFDRPISHGLSSLSLVRDGRIVATAHPRLEAQPNVLFARIQTPMTGRYIVHWTVCPEGSNDRYDGEFPLTVGDASASAANRAR